MQNYVQNPSLCACEIDEHLKSITDNSLVTCDEIIDTSEFSPRNFNNKNGT